MSSSPKDSGTGSDLQPYFEDETNPKYSEESDKIFTPYLLTKFDSNIDQIKDDISDIKHKINIDYRMIVSDISIGVLSSFIVSIIFLFITHNIDSSDIVIGGLKVPIVVLFTISIVLSVALTYQISKKIILRNRKPN